MKSFGFPHFARSSDRVFVDRFAPVAFVCDIDTRGTLQAVNRSGDVSAEIR